jgi:hypothetical protein
MEALFTEEMCVIIDPMEMENKKMTRKDFLKLAGSAALMLFVAKLGKLAPLAHLGKEKDPGYGSLSYGGKKRS